MISRIINYAMGCYLLFNANLAIADPGNYNRIHIAMVPNSIVVDRYKALIIRAYSRLGRRVALHELPAGRSLPLSNFGQLDAEMVRLSAIEVAAPNLIRIPVELGHGKLMLYCAAEVPCDKSVLDSEQHTVGVLAGVNATTIYMEQKPAKLHAENNGEQLAAKLSNKQLDYILSLDFEQPGEQSINYAAIDKTQFKAIPLLQVHAYHYLHKKHHKLVPALTSQLKKALAITD
jgi:polar amino acid transport system substrate-binding protein